MKNSNVIIENVETKETTKKLTPLQIAELQFKKLSKEKAKETLLKNKANKKAKKDSLVDKWLTDTKGLNALCTYANDTKNATKINAYLKAFNKLNNVSFEAKDINKGLLTAFSYKHESSNIDLDGKELSRKSLFNLSFLVDTLLTRKARYSKGTNVKFVELSKKQTEKYLLNKYEKAVNSFKLIYDKDTKELLSDNTIKVNLFIDNLIKESSGITKQQIVNELQNEFTANENE